MNDINEKTKWRDTEFYCPECGNQALTNSKAEDGFFYDGDQLYCPVCHTEGQVICDEGEAWDLWNW